MTEVEETLKPNKAQLVIEKSDSWDPFRTLRFSTIGFFWVGPYVRFALDKINRSTSLWYLKVKMCAKRDFYHDFLH